MIEKTFEECFVWLEKFHGKRGQITEAARAKWLETFKSEHDDVFCKATTLACERLAPGHFPTIERMKKFCAEAREEIWGKKKDAEPKRPLSRTLFRPDYRNIDRGLRWLRGIGRILDGELTAQQLIAEMGAAPADRTLPGGDR